MNIKKLKLLPSSSYLKLSLPLAALFCVFFLRSVIESSINDMISARFQGMLKVFEVDIPDDDTKFLDALEKGESPKPVRYSDMSRFLSNRFIKGFYNYQQPAETVSPEQPAPEQNTPTPENMPQYHVSAVMNGKNKKCAVISGRLINLGEQVDEISRLTAVGDSRVLLEGSWGKKWFYVQY